MVYAGATSSDQPWKIILSAHAAEAIALREIDLAWVEATIAEPDRTEPDPLPGRTRSFKRIAAFGGACCELFIVQPMTVLW